MQICIDIPDLKKYVKNMKDIREREGWEGGRKSEGGEGERGRGGREREREKLYFYSPRKVFLVSIIYST